MTRKLTGLAVLVVFAFPGWAADSSGSISGRISNSKGVPQMGAVVELHSSALAAAVRVFTDANGRYVARDLAPGLYQVKAVAVSYLPSLRENVSLRGGAGMVVNLTLNTLSEALQLIPQRPQPLEDDEDWKWTLRATTSRPVLRVLEEEGPLVVVSRSDRHDDRVLKASVAFVAGSEAEGFGGAADLTTRFHLEQSLFSSGTLALNGRLGYGSGARNSVFRASYTHELPNGSAPRAALTVRSLAAPDSMVRHAALQALALSLSNNLTLGDLVELEYGAELQSIEFMGRASAFRPFGALTLRLAPGTVVQYRYDTWQPSTRLEKGFDSAPADFSESGPRMSLRNGRPAIESARHQEVSLSQRLGDTSLQVAYYLDRISDAALIGVGAGAESAQFLPDVYSGTFSYYGGALHTDGMRVVVERRLSAGLKGALEYAYGGVLTVGEGDLAWEQVPASLYTAQRHALAARFSGRVPRADTRWIASYRWTSGRALSPVDAFDASPGQSDPYLNIFFRQPMPAPSFLPAQMEALVDVRNLLAQGYVPVLGSDGRTLYLVQSARSVRGGLAFNF